MNIDEYQEKAKTFNCVPDGNKTVHSLYGLTEEVGELMGLFKRVERCDPGARERLDSEFIKELGDIIWYVSDLASLFGVRMSTVLEENVKKLEARKAKGVIQGSGDR